MDKLKRHPLRIWGDAIARALLAEGFVLADDGSSPEIVSADWDIAVRKDPAPARRPVTLEGGRFMLRADLLAARLSTLRGPLPVKAFLIGRAYDAGDAPRPCHELIEGVWADARVEAWRLAALWKRTARLAFGARAQARIEAVGEGAYEVRVALGEKEFLLARVGRATEPARALLGGTDGDVWLFSIDVDAVAVAACGLAGREELSNPTMTFLDRFEDEGSSCGDTDRARASDALRALGFREFSGLSVYEEDCYRKMNMIQESWDTNNRGIQLAEPMGSYVGLPTVLAPALEEALAANWHAGEETCRLFQFGHIFLPGRGGAAPTEKVALSLGAYGPELDKKKWKALATEFLDRFGIANHYFIPTDRAIAYDTSDCWLLMDQNMRYLEGNFGTISPVARENHGIEAPAFMAQLEFAPLAAKAAEEAAFTPNELR